MLSLRETQAWLQQVVTCPHEQLEEALKNSSSVIKEQYGLDRESRIWIYRSMYPARMIEALTIDYPGVLYALGQEEFEALVQRYVEEHPSTSWTLNSLGREFPSFIAQDKALKNRVFLSELALLEQTLALVFEEQEVPELNPERLQTLTPEDFEKLVLKPRPTSRLHRFTYPVSTFLFQADNGHEPARPKRETQYVLVMRRNYNLNRVLQSEASYFLLQQLFAGRTLGDAVGRLTGRFPETGAPELQRWFKQWGEWGIFQS